MPISANTVFNVRSGGSDNNGGGFVTGSGGTDRSLQDAAHATLTVASTVHTTTTQINVSAGDYTVTAADVGNILQITGGTATAGIYQITAADTGNNRWTLDRSAGTAAQTVVGAMGGAFATPGKGTASATVGGNKINVKGGTPYTLTTSTPGPGGPCLFASGIVVIMEAYTTTPGDGGTAELNAGSTGSVTLFTGQGNARQIWNRMVANGNSQTAVIGFNNGNARWTAIDCEAIDCDGTAGFSGGGVSIGCKATSCATAGFASQVSSSRCWADGNGIGFSACVHQEHCIASDNTGDGFHNGTAFAVYVACTADGNGGDGFDLNGITARAISCASTNNTGFGFNGGGNTPGTGLLKGCATFNNTAGRSSGSFLDLNPVTLSGDPWTNAGTDDYSPNNTGGAGADLRAAGQSIPGQIDNFDISAVQHADPSGGGGLAANIFGGYIG